MAKLPPFIDPESEEAKVLNAILTAAGPNFVPSYIGDTQPNDIAGSNEDFLLDFNGPGGTSLQGSANPGGGGNIGTSISSLMMLLSPFISAYSMLLPIFGIIIGIIEVLCALLNPFAVGEALKRLFEKWIPAFISLFPPIAGVQVSASAIKAILAITYYIMMEIVPTIELIITNMQELADDFQNNPDDISIARIRAAQAKFDNVLKTLIQKIGIMKTFRPVFELIFLILLLLMGKPCEASGGAGWIQNSLPFPLGPDTFCCGDLCPDDIKNPPSGSGILSKSSYGECVPGEVFQISTNNSNVSNFAKYVQNGEDQLACQTDEGVDEASPVGSEDSQTSSLGNATLKVKISNSAGLSSSITLPILDIKGTVIRVKGRTAATFVNSTVNYEIIPDYDMLVKNGIIGVACIPEIDALKRRIYANFPQLDGTAVDNNPELSRLLDDYDRTLDAIDLSMNNIGDIIGEISEADDVQPLVPFTDQIGRIRDERDDLLDTLGDYIDDQKEVMTAVLRRNVSASVTEFTVDKSTVKSDGVEYATIKVIPKDVSGSALFVGAPEDVSVNVTLLTSFGSITNEQFVRSEGAFIGEIRSPIVGTASIRAKVNGELLTDFSANIGETTAVRQVNFVADAVLPTRRRKSKPTSGKPVATGIGSNREPGGRR